ncbi:aminoglycoside phosphotransferase family protein [Oerskovia sp. Sa1BUA8]|uniref:Aminoglycoside phosphotransferase family protein n=1 Tax=Oerskovia douganii TaxID=2762210 RepID=A0A9D5UJK7_9CELL|nr:aminoglycoside phosphotransferase family protein [Oerskovia douganii]MBE7701697.1 aminoglycoside phosphotransferase family protein [Oerskovia douganii]
MTGGNSTNVVRRGDTVRRTAGPWTPTVQALLAHLRAQGVTEVPEPLGLDERGREVLSFVPGEAAHYPLPDRLWDESLLRGAGALLRRVHDASVGFLVDAGVTRTATAAARRHADGTVEALDGPAGDTRPEYVVPVPVPDPGGRVWQSPAHEPVEVVCHNDVAPYNLVFRAGTLVGLIDFDTASPGPRIRDLAYLGYRLAPFVADAAGEDGSGVVGRLDPLARLDVLVEAYGLPFSRREVLTAMVVRLEEIADFTDGRAEETGRSDFLDHAAMYRADARRVAALAEDAPPA